MGWMEWGRYMASDILTAKAIRPKSCPDASHGERRLFSVPESAVYLGVSVWTVRELMWRGELPCVRIGKRRILCDKMDLDAFIAAQKERDMLR